MNIGQMFAKSINREIKPVVSPVRLMMQLSSWNFRNML